MFVVIVTAPEGNVLRSYEAGDAIEPALSWIASQMTKPEEDDAIAYDVAEEQWLASVRKSDYWGVDACIYFAVSRDRDHERYGLVRVGAR